MKTKKHLIYVLIDPITNELRYVGRSSRGLIRPKRHWRDKELEYDYYCSRWVRSLVSNGLVPEIEVLEQFDHSENINDVLNDAEIFWIAYWRSVGARLTNANAGGHIGKISEETRIKMSLSRKGKRQTKESIAKRLETIRENGGWTDAQREAHRRNSLTRIGKKLPEETCRKLSEVRRGKKRSEQARANISAARKGMKFSEEHIKNMSLSRIGKKRPVEECEKISNSMKGKKPSEEHLKNLSIAAKNRKYTEEGRRKMAEAAKRREEKKRLLKKQPITSNGII
jgi:hypothetical protein